MTLSFLVVSLGQILTLAIIARAVLSWLPSSRTLAPVVGMLDSITEPVLMPIRRRMPSFGGIDLSPLFAILLIGILESVLLGMLGGH